MNITRLALDNNRTTLSDQPGEDKQETLAATLSGTWSLSDDLSLSASVSRIEAGTSSGKMNSRISPHASNETQNGGPSNGSTGLTADPSPAASRSPRI